MGELIVLLSGILTYVIVSDVESIDLVKQKWKKEIRLAIECVFLNLIVGILVFRLLSGNSESFVNGRLNPLFVSLKHIIAIIFIGYLNGFLLKFIKSRISIKIVKERIISKDDKKK